MISPSAAWFLIEEAIDPPRSERVAVADAIGRCLAIDLPATANVPATDISAMDGFAVNGQVRAAISLPIAGIIAAGDRPGTRLPDEGVLRIMTGAPVPAGADRVIPVELAEVVGDRVQFESIPAAGRHIRRRGEIAESGAMILRAGHRVTPGTASLLATHGYREITIARPPEVAYLTTGSEIVPADQDPGPGQIRDSHSSFFAAALSLLHLPARPLGIAIDDLEVLRERIHAGLSSEVLLISGGVSMGELDLVEDVLGEANCDVLFDAVAIQPGKPMVAAKHPGGWVFALPGNPASAMVTFWLFVRPALRCMMGIDDAFWKGALEAVLSGDLPAAKGRDRYLPGELEIIDGIPTVRPFPPVGSHDVTAYAHGAALVRVPAGSPPRKAGQRCSVLPLMD